MNTHGRGNFDALEKASHQVYRALARDSENSELLYKLNFDPNHPGIT